MFTIFLVAVGLVAAYVIYRLATHPDPESTEISSASNTYGRKSGQRVRVTLKDGRTTQLYRVPRSGGYDYYDLAGAFLEDIIFDFAEVVAYDIMFDADGTYNGSTGDLYYEDDNGDLIGSEGEAYIPIIDEMSVINSTPIQLSDSPSDAFSTSSEREAASPSYESNPSYSSGGSSYSSGGSDYSSGGGSDYGGGGGSSGGGFD